MKFCISHIIIHYWNTIHYTSLFILTGRKKASGYPITSYATNQHLTSSTWQSTFNSVYWWAIFKDWARNYQCWTYFLTKVPDRIHLLCKIISGKKGHVRKFQSIKLTIRLVDMPVMHYRKFEILWEKIHVNKFPYENVTSLSICPLVSSLFSTMLSKRNVV